MRRVCFLWTLAFLFLCSCLAAGLPGRALAAYPERTITMIIPFGAGGATDVIGRYIALHLVAGAADGALAYDTVKFVKAVKEIICDTYHCTFEEESLEATRLTVHLKFLAARILRHTPWQDAGLESMYTVLLQRDSRNEVCLQRINAYLRQEFDYELDHQEQVYLLIHLTKIVG